MKTKAWNYARVVVPHLLDNMPVLLKWGGKDKYWLASYQHDRRPFTNLRDSIDDKASDAGVDGYADQLRCDSGDPPVLEVAVGVEEPHRPSLAADTPTLTPITRPVESTSGILLSQFVSIKKSWMKNKKN